MEPGSLGCVVGDMGSAKVGGQEGGAGTMKPAARGGGPTLAQSLCIRLLVMNKEAFIYIWTSSTSFFPTSTFPRSVPIPAPHSKQEVASSSPLEPGCIVHTPPLVSVSPSLIPHLCQQVSCHPKTPSFSIPLPRQLPFLLSSLLVLCSQRSSQFTAL